MVTLTVYYAEPFWVGVMEVVNKARLLTARFIFGGQPTDPMVYDLILHGWSAFVLQEHGAVEIEPFRTRKINPKRAAREAARAVQSHGISAEAEESLRLMRAAQKEQFQKQQREERLRHEQHKRQRALEKAYAKKRGH